MRVTNGMMIKRYSKNLNLNLGAMNRTSHQIASGRRFERGSEDPVRALKALQVRRSGDALEQFSSNIDTVDSWLRQTETAVMAIKSSADKAVDLVLQGRNDTLAPEDRKIIATNLRSIQEALLKDLNTQIANKYLLGGANTKQVPFTVNEDGHLMFNEQDIFIIDNIEEWMDEQEHVYADLTGEFQYVPNDPDWNFIDKSTVFDMFTTGVSIIGAGPNNLYNLIGRIAESFESEYKFEEQEINGETIIVQVGVNRMQDIDGPITDDPDYNDSRGLFERLQERQVNAIIELVKVGEKANFTAYLKERTENNLYETQVMQNNLELIPPDEAILKYKMQDYVYKACLQMSTYIFQPSLMDYLKR